MNKFLVVLLIALVSCETDYDSVVFKAFQRFIKKYQKNYSSINEFLARFQVFKSNFEGVLKNEDLPYKTGITKFSDLTKQEFARTYLNLNYDAMAMANFEPAYVKSSNAAPSSYDWRNYNRVAAVKDQGSCGSCWAFSTVANLEGLYAAKKGVIKTFSEQMLVDCDTSDSGCNGGLMEYAFTWLKNNGGIMYDSDTGYIYSVSADKKFCITEIGYLNNPSEILEGPCGFTGLYEDIENHRIFLSYEMGMVFVYLTQNFPPLLVNSLQLSSEAPIKYLDMSLIKSYIFTASSDGQIIVLDINKPGKEKLIKEISNFGGNMRLTVVKYYREQNQLITGDENGRIIIWNLKIGKSIFSWNAHEGPITQMAFMPQIKLIISAGKDKYFRTWRLPEKWQNDDVVKFEQTEIKNISDTMAMLKLQKSLSKPEEYNSDEDSLNGWDYNDEFDP